METEASRALVLDYLRAQGEGDSDRIASILDPDVHWRPPGASGLGQPKGREAVLETMAKAGADFFDLTTMKVEIKWIVAEGERVIVRQRAEAKATNGRDYDNEYVWIYICRDNKIVEIEEHVDSQRFKEIVLDS